ncbi:MgtC/SapB family protein [Candidatus Peregrinibacteria bacterium]|jgi:uncharacterized membrane protein (DUF4010 family)|nr:MgtC/SapB family protein [Candidatus Peregrinibacteria bacterium]MBT4631578.1 MgtC/SapB family protein [Candidatus Peregrinibacteria bacterium]MBT5517200.1 MgtC/SapB family protein [Candidatus Peregrinibacteria bacterium]MBT5824125.1 MgtC/SapB family protein [Candidatus Peregrinibacteria bacterium]
MTDPLFFLQNLGLALLLGGLVGLERERHHKEEKVHDFGGIRTFALVSTFAYLVYSLFGDNIILFSVFSGAVLLLVIASYLVSSIINKSIGATTELAVFFVYIVGILVAMNELLYASVITLAVVSLLYFKESLHSFAHKVDKQEIYSTLKFVGIAFVILPLLPDQAYGPLDVLNPYIIWLMVVLISSISFASYVAIKTLGPKNGIGLGGFLGGLISSTAVSMSFSSLSKKSKKVVNPFVFGIIIASTAMFFRVLLEVSVLNRDLLAFLYVPMLAMGTWGLLLSLFFFLFKGKKAAPQFTEKDLSLSSPFQLWPAIQFGLLFAALLFVSKFVSIYFGDEGLYLTAFFSGLVDVDAITVSMANLTATNDLSLNAASLAIIIATMTNTLVKGGIVFFFASKPVGRRVAISLLSIIVVGILAYLFVLNSSYGFAPV